MDNKRVLIISKVHADDTDDSLGGRNKGPYQSNIWRGEGAVILDDPHWRQFPGANKHHIVIVDSRQPDLFGRGEREARARAAAEKYEARQLEEKRKDSKYQRAEAKRARRRTRNIREGR